LSARALDLSLFNPPEMLEGRESARCASAVATKPGCLPAHDDEACVTLLRSELALLEPVAGRMLSGVASDARRTDARLQHFSKNLVTPAGPILKDLIEHDKLLPRFISHHPLSLVVAHVQQPKPY